VYCIIILDKLLVDLVVMIFRSVIPVVYLKTK